MKNVRIFINNIKTTAMKKTSFILKPLKYFMPSKVMESISIQNILINILSYPMTQYLLTTPEYIAVIISIL
jgi:hypothetical protein